MFYRLDVSDKLSPPSKGAENGLGLLFITTYHSAVKLSREVSSAGKTGRFNAICENTT